MLVASDGCNENAPRRLVIEKHTRGPGTGNAIFDRLAAGVGLVTLVPLLAAAAAAIGAADGSPIFFRQTRLGRFGRAFGLLKFRTMRVAVSGPQITARPDSRVTRVGRVLRKYKLDELPQLWNVLKGDMRLVGPRPEVPAYVDLDDRAWQAVLAVRPGITDLASLIYRNEEEVLARAENPERHYRERILPEKLRLNLVYLERRSFWLDIKLILLTVWYSFVPNRFDSHRVRLAFGVALDPKDKAMEPPAAPPKEAIL